MKEILKKNQAITLVSLVVTIIILIILAGVSINLILGENGIITKAKEAKIKTEQATLNEEIALNELYMQIEAEGISSGDASYDAIEKLAEFKREIASAITDMGVTTLEDADASTMASNIRSISGASSADKVSYDNANSGLTATNVQNAIDEVNNNLYGYTLWENTSGLNTFSAQTVNLSDTISNYKYYEVLYGDYGANAAEQIRYYLPVVRSYGNNGVRLISNGTYAYSRKGYPNGNTFVFNDAVYQASGSTSISNTNCIPFKIIGYK